MNKYAFSWRSFPNDVRLLWMVCLFCILRISEGLALQEVHLISCVKRFGYGRAFTAVCCAYILNRRKASAESAWVIWLTISGAFVQAI